ncbi:MAG: hypothetical protein ACI95C_000034 [Pseudohongiellaceae bacterium]|jgi:hypothetical protein
MLVDLQSIMTIWYKQLIIFACPLSLAVALVLQPTAVASEFSVVREFTESESLSEYPRLLKEYGSNKTLPLGYELQTLIALSHYPELKNTQIRFILADVGIPLSSRPHWSSMLRSAGHREYRVIIDTELEGIRQALLLKNQPFNAQIGIIGHELAHTVYYLERSFFGILADAACQLSSCRIGFERATDTRLIHYGLGWQRYDHALFVRSRLNSNSETISSSSGSGGAYMSPNELMSIMEQNSIYGLSTTQTD